MYMVAKLVRGQTAHGMNGKAAVETLQKYIGEQVEVKTATDHFVGTITAVEERSPNGKAVVGAIVTIDQRRGGPTVEISTFSKDDDFDRSSYIKEF